MNVIFGVIKGNLAKWWYGVTAAVTFFAMISFQLYNQESVASIAVSFAVKLVIFAVTIYYTFALRVRRLNIQMTNENRGLSCEEAQKKAVCRLWKCTGEKSVQICRTDYCR